ncbi:DNA packaging protein from bacteriophage origin [Escherichia coli]|uniref:DNA packaging protein from bacteriophage origin n=1 Tax=Escherichia coli TaxID=562 RepID=A0A376JVD4_ECOLX|nr:DNA packaging protein from bacteriophage origin [Escherichia coli]
MTKNELIARLQVLGEQLNRDVSLTGTKEELGTPCGRAGRGA